MFAKRTIAFLLTMFILFADSGQMLYAHTCLKTNTTEFSFFKQTDCCKKANPDKCCQIKKTSCCVVSAAYLKLHFSQAPNFTKHSLAVDIHFLPQAFAPNVLPTTSCKVIHRLPLIPTSKSNNAFTCTYRI